MSTSAILPLSYHIKTVFNTLHLQDLFCIILFSFIFEDFPKTKMSLLLVWISVWSVNFPLTEQSNINVCCVSRHWPTPLISEEESGDVPGNFTYHFCWSPSTGRAWLASGPWRSFSWSELDCQSEDHLTAGLHCLRSGWVEVDLNNKLYLVCAVSARLLLES